MCGSTSVACCPGATVNGSELISVRFGPTGFPGFAGCVVEEEEEEPEQQASIISAPSASTRAASEHIFLPLQKFISKLARITNVSTPEAARILTVPAYFFPQFFSPPYWPLPGWTSDPLDTKGHRQTPMALRTNSPLEVIPTPRALLRGPRDLPA